MRFGVIIRCKFLACAICLWQAWNSSVAFAQEAMLPEGVTSPAEDGLPQSFLEIILAGGWVGLAIIFVLVGLSLTAAYLVFEHLMTIRRSALMPPGLGDQVRASLAAGRLNEVNKACRSKPC